MYWIIFFSSKDKDSLKSHLIELLKPIDKLTRELCKELDSEDIIIPENDEGKLEVYEFLLMVFSNKKRQKEQHKKRLREFLHDEGIEALVSEYTSKPRKSER